MKKARNTKNPHIRTNNRGYFLERNECLCWVYQRTLLQLAEAIPVNILQQPMPSLTQKCLIFKTKKFETLAPFRVLSLGFMGPAQ